MRPISTDCETWIGSTLIDDDGRKVGTIEAVYFDEQTDRPQWMVVKTGLFGTRHSFVPLIDAMLSGDVIATSYCRRQIDEAPSVDLADDLAENQVFALYRYYALPYSEPVDVHARSEALTARVLSYIG